MWVRIAKLEGGTADAIQAETENTKQQLAQARTSGPPPGLEGVSAASSKRSTATVGPA